MSFDNFIQYQQPQARSRTPQRYIQIYWYVLWQNKLLTNLSLVVYSWFFFFFWVFIVLHLINLRHVSFQMCQVDHLPLESSMGPAIMLIPFPLLTWTNRVSDISPAKMDLFKISREFQFEVCICGEPSLSPQSARAREHFYRGEEEVGRALSKSWLFSGWALARKGEESFFLLGAAIVVTSCIKLSEAF